MTSLQATNDQTSDHRPGRFEWQDVGSLVRKNNLELVQGFCLPASCSAEKVIEYSNDVLSGTGLKAFATTCRTDDPVAFKPIDYLAMLA